MGDLNAANRYVYAGDDPVNLVDPSGKSWWDCFWAGVDTFFLLFGILVSVYGIFLAVGVGGAIGFWVALVGIVYAYIQAVRAVYGEYQVCFGQP